jgi:dTDP-4-amino-4,6-dideoxygalactose transaminase
MWGDVGALSFGGSKLLSAGRGGALVTNQEEIVQRARLYSHRGNEAYPLSELQAAVLLPQLKQLNEQNETRTRNVNTLLEMLSSQKAIVPFANLEPDTEPGHYKLGFQYNADECAGLSRDSFATAIRAEGIALDAGFRSLHKIHSKRRFRAVSDLAVADRADESVLVLHHPVLLQGQKQLAEINIAVEKVVAHSAEIGEHLSG